MKKTESGFTLIELLMTIAIVGILTAVALPFYRGHTIMARLVEVENAMSTVASGSVAYYFDQNSWPDCPTINEVRNSLGVSLGSIRRISAISISNANGMITAIIQDIDPMVDNKTLTLTPNTSSDSSISWNWGWSANFPSQFRPKSGR
jgi:prepilin-type N-terminal cleavage/methylation domain-containing protein